MKTRFTSFSREYKRVIEPIRIPLVDSKTPVMACRCPECKEPINLPTSLLDTLVECPQCGRGILIESRKKKLTGAAIVGGGCLMNIVGLAVGVFFFGLFALGAIWFALFVLNKLGVIHGR